MKKLDVTALNEAADMLESHAKRLSQGRVTVEYNPFLVDSVQAAAYILRSIGELGADVEEKEDA